MKTTIDLTNYENFYKTPDELKELRKELYKLALETDWSGWTDTDDEEQLKEFLEFVNEENDPENYNEDWSELLNKVYNAQTLKDDLSIEELMYFIEQTKDFYYSFWTFAKWNEKRNEFWETPKLHTFSTSQHKNYERELYFAQNFIIPEPEADEE